MQLVKNRRTRLSGRRAVPMAAVEAMESRWLLAATIYVDQQAPGTLRDGSSWDTAYVNLRDAINAAQSGDDIAVAGGTYLPPDGVNQALAISDRFLTFSLKSGVGIYGGFAGRANPGNPDARDVSAYETILSGDIGTPGYHGDDSYHVVTASGTDLTAVIDGFTISDGNANAPSGTARSFSNGGGGMIVWFGGATIHNCIFDTNRAYDGGAGLFAENSTVEVTDSTFLNNTSTAGSGLGGGAAIQTGSGTFDGCIFDSNNANYGGGFYAVEGSATLSNSTFAGNRATEGGGVAIIQGSSAMITGSVFERNLAQFGGGVASLDNSPVTLVQVKLLGNTASTGGGAICLSDNSTASTFTNCLLVGNRATTVGGAIYNSNSSPTLINCTITHNEARGTVPAGGAIFNNISSPTVVNCIVWADTGGEILNTDNLSLPLISYTDIQDGWSGTGNVNVDPQFMQSPGPGADNNWGTVDDNYGDVRLRPISPIVDAGNNAALSADTTTDINGNPRFVNVPLVPDFGSGTAPIVDMGACETPSLWPVAFDTDAQDVNETDGTVTLTVELTAVLPYNVTVPLTFGGSAVQGHEYTVPARVLTITAGNLTASMNIQLLDDHTYEPDSTIVISMGTPSGAVAGDIVQQTITIADDTDAPVLDPIADQTVNYTETLTVQAHAADPFVPGPSVVYSLDGVVPAGASITPAGLFTWTPLPGQPIGATTFTIRVSSITDSSLFDTQSFQVQHTILSTKLTGNLFHDFNRNNQTDSGEGPLAGWTVYADLNNNGIADGSDPSTLTDAGGHWEISGIMPANIHVVTVVPAGWLTTTPVMTNLPFTVPSGRTIAFNPVGFYRLLNYTGSVFQDANNDRVLQAGEAGLAGSTVWADLNNNGVADAGEPRAAIGASGTFALNGLTEGPVVVRATVPSGWLITNFPDGYTTPTIPDTQPTATINFSAIQLASVVGAVYLDANGNGVRDLGEPGFAGTSVWLDLNQDGVLNSSEPSAMTDAAGQFTIPSVQVGAYTLRAAAQNGYDFTSPATGVLNVTRTAATPSVGNNFALRRPVGVISGTVFVDANSDGVRQPSEKLSSGIRVLLLDVDSGLLRTSTVTGAAGQFTFSDLPIADSYRLMPTLPARYRFTTDTSEVLHASMDTPVVRSIGMTPFASVSGRVFLDSYRNGQFDVGEKALANWRVFIDANRNGVLDAGEVSVLTDSKGNYSFDSLAAGAYSIRLAPQKGYKVSLPVSGANVATVSAGQKWDGKNFAVVKA